MTDKNWQASNSLTQCVRIMYENHLDDGDITFKVGAEGAEVKAHKFILMCRSSVLCDMVKDGEALTINDIERDLFRQFLEFLYTDKTKVTEDNLEGLLFCADKFKTSTLAAHCRSSLQEFISTSIVCKVMEIAHRFDDTEIFEICFQEVDAHTPNFFFTDDFLKMCPSCIYKIIQRDSVLASEEVIFDQVVNWSKEECKRRSLPETGGNQREVLGDILKEIRFPIMEHQYLNDVVCESGILNDKEKVDILQQQLKARTAKPFMFKSKTREWKPLDLMMNTHHRTSKSDNYYDLDEYTGLVFTAHCNAFLVGIYLNVEGVQANDKKTINNLIVRLKPQEDRETDKFIVPFSECVATKYIKLYPHILIKLSKETKYTISIGFDSSLVRDEEDIYHKHYVEINQKVVTNSYSQFTDSLGEETVLDLHDDTFQKKQLICGFRVSFL